MSIQPILRTVPFEALDFQIGAVYTSVHTAMRPRLQRSEPVSHRNYRRRSSQPKLAGDGRNQKPPRRERHQEKFSVPGEPIPETGIYEVMHDHGHRSPHEAVLHRGDLFPECETCQAKVRFRLVRTAPYIFDDEDFAPE